MRHTHTYLDTKLRFWHDHQIWYWVVLLVLALIALLLLLFANLQFERDFRDSQNTTSVVSKDQAVLIRILIDFGEARRAFEGEARKGMTVRSALQEITEVAGLKLQSAKGEILLIGDVKSTPSRRWNIYLNDEVAEDLSRELKGGDRIAVRYE